MRVNDNMIYVDESMIVMVHDVCKVFYVLLMIGVRKEENDSRSVLCEGWKSKRDVGLEEGYFDSEKKTFLPVFV
jgi:hypothetical protein